MDVSPINNKLDKHSCKILTCEFKDIRNIFEKYHYKKGHMGGGISICFAMFINDVLVGGSVLGKWIAMTQMDNLESKLFVFFRSKTEKPKRNVRTKIN